MMFGSYRTVYGGAVRMVQQADGSVGATQNPWLLEPGLSMAHRLKLVPQKVAPMKQPMSVPKRPKLPPPPPKARGVAPAGQASTHDPSPWIVLGVMAAGVGGYLLLKQAIKSYAR